MYGGTIEGREENMGVEDSEDNGEVTVVVVTVYVEIVGCDDDTGN